MIFRLPRNMSFSPSVLEVVDSLHRSLQMLYAMGGGCEEGGCFLLNVILVFLESIFRLRLVFS